MKEVTQKDVAVAARVSRSAVSMVLNNSSGCYRISPSTQRRVMKAIQELGYSNNFYASCLRGRKRNVVGVIGLTHGFPIRQFRQGLIAQYFVDRGFRVVLQDFKWNDDPVDSIKEIETLKPQGLIISELLFPEAVSYLRRFRKKGVPLVVIDGAGIHGLDRLTIDREMGAYLAVKHLLEQGYREVCFMSKGLSRSWKMADRYKGFRRAYSEFKPRSKPDDLLIWLDRTECPNPYRRGYALGEKMLGKGISFPAGITGLNDQVASGVMKKLLDTGIRVPGEAGIVGAENLPEGEFTAVPLTTISFPVEELARKACDVLMKRIGGDKSGAVSIKINPELIVRVSSIRRGCGSSQPLKRPLVNNEKDKSHGRASGKRFNAVKPAGFPVNSV